MKNLFLAVSFVTILASCSSSTTEATAPAADSTTTKSCVDTCKKATCDSVKAEAATITTVVAPTTATTAK